MRAVRGSVPSVVLCLCAAVVIGADGAAAHDFFLIPDTATPERDAPLRVAMHVSDTFPGAPVAWRGPQIREFFLVDDQGRLSLDGAPVEGDPPAARLALRHAGGAVIALRTTPSRIEMAPEEFEDYLRHEGHDAILRAWRAGPSAQRVARERYARCVKTIVRAPGAPSKAELQRVGLPIEIVPGVRTTGLRPGGSLPVRVFVDEKPYAGGYLCATHAGFSTEHDAYAWCGRLDGDGRARVPIRAPGWQLIRITHMVPLRDDPQADWESLWGALTFEVPVR